MSHLPCTVSDFVAASHPCGAGRKALVTSPSDGGVPSESMADVWTRSKNGLWLEWILRLQAQRGGPPVPPELRAAREAHRVGELVRKRKAMGLPFTAAVYRSEKWREPLADYANVVRALAPNPFMGDGPPPTPIDGLKSMAEDLEDASGDDDDV